MNQTPSETYRDNIATVDASGKRRWIYPSIPKGKFTTYRKWFSYLLILFLIGMPFVKVDGHPYFLLNVVDRHFILFGQPFWPQDLKILLLILITFILFIIAFTSIWGRLWCGWACPQTVFLEMVFRRVEFAIEGDGLAQKKLNKAPWNLNKISKKLSKHFIFVLLAYGVGHIFLSWIIGVDQLKRIVSEPIQDHLAGFIGINFFSLMFYAVFSWFREQACVIVCPYGRFQSVLLDKNTTVISYDFKRGEPRGKRSKAQDLSHQGDCVNCLQCVRVCPTGIDIRQGTQLECVNCTACIDACDHIMTKLKLPKGLIKFASYNQISQGFQKHFTTRVKAYIFVLTLLLGICVSLIFTRDSVHVTVTRVHGSVYQELADGSILNLYKIKFANNSFKEKTLTLKLSQDRGELRAPAQINIPSYNTQEVMINVQLKKNELINKKLQIPLQVFENKQVISEEKLTFISPIQKP